MDRSRLFAVGPRDRSRRRSQLHLTFLALATALAFAAPLAHAHLDAANSAAHGLCGEHLPASDAAVPADACPVCLAGAHSPALHPSTTSQPDAPALATSPVVAATPRVALERPHAPGDPRAPPASA